MTDPKTPSAPHECPDCGEPAYIGFGLPAQCTSRECPFWSEDCWVKHVVELPDEEIGVEFEIEDEPTHPKLLGLPTLDDYLFAYANPPPIKSLVYQQSRAKVQKAIDETPVPFVLSPLDNDDDAC